MNTFLDTNLSKTKSFVIYGNLKDKIWCPDLLPRDIEHYLVKYLKSRGFEHVIFYGGAGTKGAYCHDEKSTRFFFDGNKFTVVYIGGRKGEFLLDYPPSKQEIAALEAELENR